METLEALAVRCEGASGPDRELDLAIWRVVDPKAAEVEAAGRRPLKWLHCHTSSLDDAMSLVPEGWRIRMLDASIAGRFSWSLTGPKVPIEDPESPGLIVSIPGYACATGPHIAATLAAAALRAHLLAQKDEVS